MYDNNVRIPLSYLVAANVPIARLLIEKYRVLADKYLRLELLRTTSAYVDA